MPPMSSIVQRMPVCIIGLRRAQIVISEFLKVKNQRKDNLCSLKRYDPNFKCALCYSPIPVFLWQVRLLARPLFTKRLTVVIY
jgi:hypothetical protein